ncbi:AEC family transporter [Bacillus suaedaesalsae]|uniref:AEC family transporter n=1 Tax=Bacillus suaedaesalsae TaxID=2810349 RepID=A0ABS2DMF0_9BACI|nr:AEC family transporter [Bacillus suaedaesalsae]MBM6619638.1 AEC family transporter [Bacillus suaedaesalsae]
MDILMVLLPVVFIFAIGFIGQKFLRIEPRNVSRVAVYLLTPFLAFRTFYENDINTDYLYLFLFALGLCFGLISIVYAVSYIKKYSKSETSSLILSSVFMNNGNYGVPVALFAFGAAGFDVAIILMVIQSLIMSTIGVYYAAKGSSEKQTGFKGAALAVLKMPVVYCSVLGVTLQLTHITIPKTFYQSIELVADAAIPTVMIVLGMQLATITIKNIEHEKTIYSLLIKLTIAPVVAWLFASQLPVSDLVQSIMILMAAMPSAANTTLLSLEYNTKPDFVSSVTLLSTIGSIITLPIVLAILT